MTEAYLLKRIAYFAKRIRATRDHRDTPQRKRAYTLAQNLHRQSRRQLVCLRATGSIKGWSEYKLDE